MAEGTDLNNLHPLGFEPLTNVEDGRVLKSAAHMACGSSLPYSRLVVGAYQCPAYRRRYGSKCGAFQETNVGLSLVLGRQAAGVGRDAAETGRTNDVSVAQICTLMYKHNT